MDLQQMASWIQAANNDPNGTVNGTNMHINEQLEKQGQQLYWDGETYYIGEIEPEGEVSGGTD